MAFPFFVDALYSTVLGDELLLVVLDDIGAVTVAAAT